MYFVSHKQKNAHYSTCKGNTLRGESERFSCLFFLAVKEKVSSVLLPENCEILEELPCCTTIFASDCV